MPPGIAPISRAGAVGGGRGRINPPPRSLFGGLEVLGFGGLVTNSTRPEAQGLGGLITSFRPRTHTPCPSLSSLVAPLHSCSILVPLYHSLFRPGLERPGRSRPHSKCIEHERMQSRLFNLMSCQSKYSYLMTAAMAQDILHELPPPASVITI